FQARPTATLLPRASRKCHLRDARGSSVAVGRAWKQRAAVSALLLPRQIAAAGCHIAVAAAVAHRADPLVPVELLHALPETLRPRARARILALLGSSANWRRPC